MDYTKHMLRFRLREAPLLIGVPEIVLVNAHDGGSAYQMMLGLCRLLCKNGLVVSQGCFDRISVRHASNISGEIFDAAQRIINEAHGIAPAIQQMRELQLTDNQKMTFATAALKLRFRRDKRTCFTLSLERGPGEPRVGQSLGVFSRLVVTHPFVSVNHNIRLNRSLWTLVQDLTGVKGVWEHGRGRVIVRKRAAAVEPAQR